MKAIHLFAAVVTGFTLVGCGSSSSTTPAESGRGARADVMDLSDSPPKPIAPAPRATAAPIEPAASAVATPEPATAPRKHVVAAKDTLYAIAKQYYGEGKQYPKIIAANPGIDEKRLPVGKTIIIP